MSTLVPAFAAVFEQTSEHTGEVTGLGFPLLPVMVLCPLLGAIVIALLPKERVDVIRLVAVLSSVAAGALGIVALAQFEPGAPGFQFVSSATWIESLDIKFILGIDGISLFLVVLTGILFPISLLASKPEHDPKGYYAWLTLLEVGCLGVFCALDLFVFFLFFEITLVPLYMLIGKWGHGRRVYAATKFFVFTMLGSAFMLVAIVSLAILAKAGDGGTISFDLQKVIASQANLGTVTSRLIFVGMAVAFMVKTPVFPFHTWLPDAHTEAPTAGSVNLAGILLKLGTYGFLRYGLQLFPEASLYFAPTMITLGAIGIIYGGIVAAMQQNLKRLVAYSSVAHMGFCVMGLFALTIEGVEGSVLQMINHGITTGALFILLGFLYRRRHTYELAELRGIQKVAPVFAGVFTVVMLASIGVPGLNGFVGEFLVLAGTFIAHRWWAVVAAIGVIIAALYLLWAYQRAFHGEPDEANRTVPDLDWGEKLVIAPLVALIVFLGVYPKPVLDRIEPAVRRVLEHVEVSTGRELPSSRKGADLAPLVGDGHGASHPPATGLDPGAEAEHAEADR
ncbi:MAG: NADH-quinone oxidoreductase subunit M [Acidimicrobiales bacterium]|nr:NADH-quinone oxidoreductase subunit M [Acidimicrobiales bacterium]